MAREMSTKSIQLVVALVLLTKLSVSHAEICGQCTVDLTSSTGYSQFCRFGPGTVGKRPCNPDQEPSSNDVQLTGADLNLGSDDLPVCKDYQVDSWHRIVTDSLGVAGRDVAGVYIRGFPVEKNWLLHPYYNNWYPNDVYKQTLCGKLHRFGVYDGGWPEADEMDWNNFIIPNLPYRFIWSDTLIYADSLDPLFWKKCGNTRECVEAELTPDQRFYENPWFPKTDEISPLENENARGPTVCTYGPWIRERIHHGRPEIHPSELIWWKDHFADGSGEI